MKHNRFYVLPFLCVLLVFLLGCGDPKITGKVTFPDGSPLTVGTICFETSQYTYYGDLTSKGTFSMGKTHDGQGAPAGSYRVYVRGAQVPIGRDNEGNTVYEYLVDDKFFSPDTSGLTCTVSGKTRLDIQVTAPGK